MQVEEGANYWILRAEYAKKLRGPCLRSMMKRYGPMRRSRSFVKLAQYCGILFDAVERDLHKAQSR